MDVLEGIETYVKVLDHGSIELLDCMPRNRCVERAIVEAARVSTGADRRANKLTINDKKLIKRLYKDKHTSPFEMVEFKFAIDMPLFVMRQWVRHRTGSFNEYSARYSQMKDEFYVPETVRMQHSTNKQMSSNEIANSFVSAEFIDAVENAHNIYSDYERFCNNGIARELTRIILPVSVYTRVYWKVSLHNFLNFMSLRLAPDAQYEIRVFAEAAYNMVKQLCPNTCQAFEDYRLNSVTFTQTELVELKTSIENDTRKKVMEDIEWKTRSFSSFDNRLGEVDTLNSGKVDAPCDEIDVQHKMPNLDNLLQCNLASVKVALAELGYIVDESNSESDAYFTNYVMGADD